MRILGFDVGDRRIGIAMSDPLGLTAQPLTVIESTQLTAEWLKQMIDDYDIEQIVVGRPLNRFGEPTAQTRKIEKWVSNLVKNNEYTVVYWDERYSTKAAKSVLIEADISRKNQKKVIDKQAAVFILQGYLDYQSNKDK